MAPVGIRWKVHIAHIIEDHDAVGSPAEESAGEWALRRQPSAASGYGLDLRGFGFVLASMAGAALTFAAMLAYDVGLGWGRRHRQAASQR